MSIRFEYDDRGQLTGYDANNGECLGQISTMGDLQPEIENQRTSSAFPVPPFRVCYLGKTSPLELTHGTWYTVVSVERGWFRIVDDTGEDYLYPNKLFRIEMKK